jgi:hypothetical protein
MSDSDVLGNIDPAAPLEGEASYLGEDIEKEARKQNRTLIADALNLAAPGVGTILKNNTTELCAGAGIGAIVGVSGNACIGQSHLDQIGVSATKQGGADILGSAGIALFPAVSNAQTFGALGGPFKYSGGSLLFASGEYATGGKVTVASLGGQLDITDVAGSVRHGTSDTATATWSLPWGL